VTCSEISLGCEANYLEQAILSKKVVFC